MADDGDLFEGLGNDRPLPAELRARLEAALLEAAGLPAPSGVAASGAAASGADASDPAADAQLPAPFRDRLAARLKADPVDLLSGIDAPRPLPASTRTALEHALSPGPRAGRQRRWWATRPSMVAAGTAAAAVLIAGSLALVASTGRGSARRVAAGPPQSTSTTTTSAASAASGAALGVSSGGATASATSAQARSAPAAGLASGLGGAGGGGSAAEAVAPAPASSYPPPPFAAVAVSTEAAGPNASPPPGSPGPSPTTTTPGPPLVIGIVGGDPAQEAGFRAYVELLNHDGGVRGRSLALVAVSPRSPAPASIATVNLSPAAIATTTGPPSWTRGPLIETLAVPEADLRGQVFDFASAPARQAHLVADAVYPTASAGRAAVIYQAAGGVLATDVPAALQQVLTARGVAVTRVTYQPGSPIAWVPADTAFLSLDTAAARAWFGDARSAGYQPASGVAGIYSLLDPEILQAAPNGTRILSPYQLPTGAELQALEAGSGRKVSAATISGWVGAKCLAVALWQTGAATPDAVTAALNGLIGFQDGFAPPYEVRPGTHSRTPEGLLYAIDAGTFSPVSDFRRDPFS